MLRLGFMLWLTLGIELVSFFWGGGVGVRLSV